VILAFVWGSLNLWWRIRIPESESQQWTFGQVIAVVLLTIPVIALLEGYFKRKSNLFPTIPDKKPN
jgi:hypothetical protein